MKVLFRFFLFLACLFVAVVVLFAIVHRDKRPLIYFAAEAGDTNALGKYLAQGSNINTPITSYPYGVKTSPLLNIAAQKGQVSAVDFLLKNGADPNLEDSSRCTPLLCASFKGENEETLRSIQFLLKAGANPNMKSSGGFWTPLNSAAMLGQSKILQALIAAGADVRATNGSGQTALHFAANPEIATMLLTAGADPTANKCGETPEESATRQGRLSVKAVIEKGAHSAETGLPKSK